jgi:hypothetical protein
MKSTAPTATLVAKTVKSVWTARTEKVAMAMNAAIIATSVAVLAAMAMMMRTVEACRREERRTFLPASLYCPLATQPHSTSSQLLMSICWQRVQL